MKRAVLLVVVALAAFPIAPADASWSKPVTIFGKADGQSWLGTLSDGSVIAAADDAYVLARGRAFRWTEHGYEGPLQIPRADVLLTPPSTLGALRAGYRPVLHPSIDTMQAATTDA